MTILVGRLPLSLTFQTAFRRGIVTPGHDRTNAVGLRALRNQATPYTSRRAMDDYGYSMINAFYGFGMLTFSVGVGGARLLYKGYNYAKGPTKQDELEAKQAK